MIFIQLILGCSSQPKIPTEDLVDTGIQDLDGDGYMAEEDCDDNNSVVHPGIEELCDGIDNNCNGEIDEGVTATFYQDLDEDGYGSSTQMVDVIINGDCNDDASQFPGGEEICDGVDNDFQWIWALRYARQRL